MVNIKDFFSHKSANVTENQISKSTSESTVTGTATSTATTTTTTNTTTPLKSESSTTLTSSNSVSSSPTETTKAESTTSSKSSPSFSTRISTSANTNSTLPSASSSSKIPTALTTSSNISTEQLSSTVAFTSSSPSSAVTPQITNFAQNAAQNHPKLIPIQSVLNTSDPHLHNQQLSIQNATVYNSTQINSGPSSLHQFLTGNNPQLPSELPQEDEKRLEKLFKRLDRDGNGKIDIHDLSEALREFGLSSVYAEKFLEHSDKDQSGDVGLGEFVHYVREHEKNLRLQFSHLDKNKDGKVDLEELISAFKDLGIEVDKDEAKNLLLRMDQDGSLNISFNEWRDFLLLAPSTDIRDLIRFWRHSTRTS